MSQASLHRVLDEKAAVDEKIRELGTFLNSPEANKVNTAERYWWSTN
jgi:hypothetical protein